MPDVRTGIPLNIGGKPGSIVLSERQLAALADTGREAMRPAGPRSSRIGGPKTISRQAKRFWIGTRTCRPGIWCASLSLDWAAAGQIQSVLEIAFGGLHEYRAMRNQLKELKVSYSGIDWTEHFVTHAQSEFPESRWMQGDIVRGVSAEPADVVYSQHMLEHIPALEPAFSNMLRLARKKLINIFFIPPKPFPNYDVVNWEKFPLYHNTYSIGHIEAICRSMNFTCKWVPFEKNPAMPGVGLGQDVVLICERQSA